MINSNKNIINCYNIGNIEGDYVGGLVGILSGSAGDTPNFKVLNSYNTGNIIGRKYSGGITRVNISSAIAEFENTYYLDTTANIGVDNYTAEGVSTLSETYMKSQDFVNDLNNNLSSIETDIELNKWKYVENDYPIFE